MRTPTISEPTCCAVPRPVTPSALLLATLTVFGGCGTTELSRDLGIRTRAGSMTLAADGGDMSERPHDTDDAVGADAGAETSAPHDMPVKPSSCGSDGVHDGPLILRTPADVAAANSCSEVRGDLWILVAELSSLRGLEELENVTGDLRIAPTMDELEGSAPRGTPGLESLAGLEGLRHVGSLALNDLKVTDLTSLQNLSTASSIQISRLEDLHDLRGLEQVAWSELNLADNAGLRSLNGLHAPASATAVEITQAPQLESIDALSGLTSATAITLSDLPALKNLNGLGALTSIGTLSIGRCNMLSDLSGLGAMVDVTVLSLSDDQQLQSLKGLQLGPSIAEIAISDCPALTSLAGLITKPGSKVEQLALQNLPALSSVDGLEGLMVASWLSLLQNRGLLNLRGLRALDRVSMLMVAGNTQLPQCEVDWLYQRLSQNAPAGANGPAGTTCAP